MVPFLSLWHGRGPASHDYVRERSIGSRTPHAYTQNPQHDCCSPTAASPERRWPIPSIALPMPARCPGDFGLYLYLAPWTRAYAARTLTRRGRHMGEHDHRMRKRGKTVLIGFLLVASFFLLTEHTAHFLGVLPYLIDRKSTRLHSRH